MTLPLSRRLRLSRLDAARLSAFGLILPVILVASPPAAAGAAVTDDTFACLADAGREVITVEGDYGYNKYHYRKPADHAVFDARDAKWNFQTFPTPKQNYPISVKGGARDACWVGGLVEGTNPRAAGWSETYAVSNGSGFNFGSDRNTESFTLDGIRIHNAWDGIRPRGNTDNFHIKNVWVSHNRDDCLENDHRRSGVVEDSLFDGCHMGVSMRAGRGGGKKARARATPAVAAEEADGAPADADGGKTLELRGNLWRLEPFPKPNARHVRNPWYRDPGHGMFFKIRPDTIKFKLYDNVFMMEQPPVQPKVAWGLPPAFAADRLADCKGNVLVWLGEGDFPGPLHNNKFPGCWTVVTDRAVWERAKKDWIDRHPKVARLPGDPRSHPDEAVGLDAILDGVR